MFLSKIAQCALGVLVSLAIVAPFVSARDLDCIPARANAEALGPKQEEIKQMVERAFHERVAKSSQGPSDASPVGGARPVRRFRRSADEEAREKRSFNDKVECPTENDQALPYNLGSNPEGYPIDLITAELFQRSLPGSDLLFQCLAREVIQKDQGPTLETQPLLANGTSCPQVLSQLWTYNSVSFGNILCWAMANFGEDILYNAECRGRPCLGCDSNSFYHSFGFDTEIRKTCFPRYRTVSLWAFCPSLEVGKMIVRDRLIVPSDCSCTSVTCKRVQDHYKPDIWNHPFFNNH